MILDTEEWETFPDNYDGAAWMQHRGRIEVLNNYYEIDYEHKQCERET